MSYKHLSQTERYQIYALMKAGLLPVEIAKLLGLHIVSLLGTHDCNHHAESQIIASHRANFFDTEMA